MFLLFLGAVYVSLMCALPILTAAMPKFPQRTATIAQQPTLQQLDRDRDGFVDRYEAEALPGLDRVFNEADRRPDGRLDRVEFARAMALIGSGSRP